LWRCPHPLLGGRQRFLPSTAILNDDHRPMAASRLRIAQQSHWDVIVVGTGMGGAMVGYGLAKAGCKVLFCERGESLLFADKPANDAFRGRYAEQIHQSSSHAFGAWPDVLSRSGRQSTPLEDRSTARATRFIPFAGCGTGGSTSIFGAVMQRLSPEDFTPQSNYRCSPDANLPVRWPITYEELRPFYRAAESLFGVQGASSPLRRHALDPLPPRDPIKDTDPAKELTEHFRSQGLHPYQPPMSYAKTAGCLNCQGFLCPRPCRKDSAEVGLVPALESYGAELLTETEAVELVADQHSVREVICVSNGERFVLRAELVILAGGAFETPKLLLNSRSAYWPDGVANRSGLVGRNLMRRYFDVYFVFPNATRSAETGKGKEIYLDDFFVRTQEKLGIVQSFGEFPPAEVMIHGLEQTLSQGRGRLLMPGFRLIEPALRSFLRRQFSGAYALVSTMEDLPYLHNRVYPAPSDPRMAAFEYRIGPAEAERIRKFRLRIRTLLRGYRYRRLRMAEDPRMFIAVSCGTCRFGDDPATSVLDAQNRAHGIDNLYVVDSSFFPSASALNPALTIAANALRVSDAILRRKYSSSRVVQG
jgi:choline dehydrogenase-like flavoprotein